MMGASIGKKGFSVLLNYESETLAIATLFASFWLAAPSHAQISEPASRNTQTAQAQPTADQVLDACVNNRADTLPIPFVDVSPNDWAFKAVMNLYYCGVIGPNTPPEVIQRLRNTPNQQSSQIIPKFEPF